MIGRISELQQRPLLFIVLAAALIAVFSLAGIHGIIPVGSKMTCHPAGVSSCATIICAAVVAGPFLLTVILFAFTVMVYFPALKSEPLFVFEKPPKR